jgi:iron complex transport system substrate-binding protein
LLGEGDRVVGVSGYTVRPPEARQKPRISSFLHARFDAIEALHPDLILAFSDLQADVTSELVRRGHPVYTFNQRSVDEILQMILIVGGLVGRTDRAQALVDGFRGSLEAIGARASGWTRRPRVYFEEWDDPLISGIRWVEELVEIAGGTPIFPELRDARLAKARIVTGDDVARRDPEVIVASWCGKRVNRERIAAREGWAGISAVRSAEIHEIKSSLILQPGPAALTEGVAQLHDVIVRVAAADRDRS